MKAYLFLIACVAAVAIKGETYLDEVSDFNDDDDSDVMYVDMNLTAKKCKDDYTKCVKDASWWARIGGLKKCKFNVLYGCCNDLHHRCRGKSVNLKDYLKCQDEMFDCKLPPKVDKS